MSPLHGWEPKAKHIDQIAFVREQVRNGGGSASFEGLGTTSRAQMKRCAAALIDEGYHADVYGHRSDTRSVLTVTVAGAEPQPAARYDY